MKFLQMSITSGIMIMMIILVRTWTINRLPKKTFLALWGVTLFRLLIPISFPSPFSVYSLANQSKVTRYMENTGTFNLLPMITADHNAGITSANHAAGISPAVIIWIAGLMTLIVYFTVSYVCSLNKFAASLPAENDFLSDWLKNHKIKRQIVVRQADRIESPLTYGLFRPVILMPKMTDWSDEKKLQYVLQHEYVHIRRFDVVIKMFLTAALCVHWFNPLVWIMYSMANRDIELSCDEAVIHYFGDTTKSDYALTLIGMEESRSSAVPFYNNFSKNAIEERIKAIMKIKKPTMITIGAALALVALISTGFATSPSKGNQDMGKEGQTVVYDSVELRRYEGEDGHSYLHEVKTNNTTKKITEYQVGILAFDQDGNPLEISWLSEDQPNYYHLAIDDVNEIAPGKTFDEVGGWSLKESDASTSKIAYSLFCDKQITFEDGTVWENPDFENWLSTYQGKKVDVDILKNYYPYIQKITF